MCFHVEDVALIPDSEPKPLANHTHGRDSALANGKGLVLRQVPTTTWNGMEQLTIQYEMEKVGYGMGDRLEIPTCGRSRLLVTYHLLAC